MRVALMQPYLFPYLGYLQLVAAVDRFVVFDHVQFQRRGWMHRNRVLAHDGSWRWVGLPVVRCPRDTPIDEVEVSREVDVRARFLDALAPYEPVAPHHAVAVDLVDRWSLLRSSSLVETVRHAITLTCELLGLEPPTTGARALGVTRAPDAPVSAWAVDVCRRTGASTYVNPAGGRALYPAEDLTDAGLGLAFLEPELTPYPRGGLGWEPALSVLDVLAFAGVEAPAVQARGGVLDTVVAAA